MARSVKRLKPEQPITRSSQRILRERLRVVWDYLQLTAKGSVKKIEYVHQLRVATRRAEAALDIFQDLLPTRGLHWMRNTLRELRKAAGKARDLDVLNLRLREITEQFPAAQFDALFPLIVKRRRKAQRPLLVRYRRAQAADFKKRSRQLVRAVAWSEASPEPTVLTAARSLVAPLVNQFFTAASADLSGARALHTMRIRGKQLRYALELVGGVFDEALVADVYTTITQVQERLGGINDCAVAIATLGKWQKHGQSKVAREVFDELMRRQEEQQEVLSAEFRIWWTESRALAFYQAFTLMLDAPPQIAPDS